MRLRHLARTITLHNLFCSPPDCKNKHVASPRCNIPRCKHLLIEKDRGPSPVGIQREGRTRGPSPVHIQREAGSRSIDRSPPHAPTSPARWRLRMAAGCGGEARAVRACARAWGGERAARARGGEHAARRPRAQPSPQTRGDRPAHRGPRAHSPVHRPSDFQTADRGPSPSHRPSNNPSDTRGKGERVGVSEWE